MAEGTSNDCKKNHMHSDRCAKKKGTGLAHKAHRKLKGRGSQLEDQFKKATGS